MSGAVGPGILAIDVGTSRVKLGWFPDAAACDSEKPSQLPIAQPLLPEPAETFDCLHRDQSKLAFAEQLAAWLGQFVDSKPRAVIASVNPPVTTTVVDTLKGCGFAAPRIMQTAELPLQLAVDEPAKLGIDRALAAVGVNRIRPADTPAIVISLGTACTVNLISADGMFQGGAVLPGFSMAANALHSGTASLPLVTHENLVLPENGIGKSTQEAMSIGLFWGLVGAVEKVVAQSSQSLEADPQLYFTGGEAPLVIDGLIHDMYFARFIPHLVLSGIAIACEAEP
jgi:type III pantothenate kinase